MIDKKKKLMNSLLKKPTSVDEQEVIPEEYEHLVKRWSPSDFQFVKERFQNLDRHDLYAILSGQTEDELGAQKPIAPMTREEVQEITKKIEVANFFMDYAKNDTEKQDVINLVKSPEMDAPTLFKRAGELYLDRVPKDEAEKMQETRQKALLNLERKTFKEVKEQKWAEYSATYKPGRKLTKRTGYMTLGLVAIAGGLILWNGFSNEKEKRAWYQEAAPAIERRVLEENGLPTHNVTDDALPGDYTFKDYLKDEFFSSKDTTDADTIVMQPVVPGQVADTTVNADSSKMKKPVIPLDSKIIGDMSYQDFLKALAEQVGDDYQYEVVAGPVTGQSYKVLKENNPGMKRVQELMSIDVSSENYTNIADPAKLKSKLSKIQSFAKERPNDLAGYSAMEEVVWLSYENLGDIKPEVVSEYINNFVNTFGNTEKMLSSDDFKSMVEKKWDVSYWIAASSTKDENSRVSKANSSLNSWLVGLSKNKSPLGYEAAYFLANLSSGNEVIYLLNGGGKDFISLSGGAMRSLNNARNNSTQTEQFAGYLGTSAQQDSARISRAMYTFADFNHERDNLPVGFAHAVEALEYGGLNADWGPQTLYMVADMEEKMGNFEMAAAAVTLMNKNFPSNEYSKSVWKIQEKIDTHNADARAKSNAAKEAEFERLK